MLSTANYYKDKGVRDVCHGLKGGDSAAINVMAQHMATYVRMLPPDSILIPVPSRTGHATYTLLLAEYISRLTGVPVIDIIKGKDRESLYALKLEGQKVNEQFFGFYRVGPIGNNTPILVDSVFDTGQTGSTASRLFKAKVPIVFTFARVCK